MCDGSAARLESILWIPLKGAFDSGKVRIAAMFRFLIGRLIHKANALLLCYDVIP